MTQIHIANWPRPVPAGRLSILEAALDAGVPFPHGCGAGECGGCKCRLLEGQVTSQSCSPDALSAAETAEGLILACRSRALTDVRVQWIAPAATLPTQKLSLVVSRLYRAAHDVMVVHLALPDAQAFAFHPGQFARLRIGKLPERSYSMANQPGHGELHFHVRVVPGGKVSQHVAQQLKVGDKVQVHGPFGDAHWDSELAQAHAGPLLLLAGGTGMAPMLSVLDAALGGGREGRDIHVYHGVRGEADLYAADQLKQRERAHGIRFVPVFAQGSMASQRQGMLHEAVRQDYADLSASVIHVAGPPPMVDAVVQVATALGAPRERILADAFHAAVAEKPSLWSRLRGLGAAA